MEIFKGRMCYLLAAFLFGGKKERKNFFEF